MRMSREVGAEDMRTLLRSLFPEDAQILAACCTGIPRRVLAASCGMSEYRMKKREARIIFELTVQQSLLTDADALQRLKAFVDDGVNAVLTEFLLNQNLPSTLHIEDYLRKLRQPCKFCSGPIQRSPGVETDSRWRAAILTGRPREYCSDTCRQKGQPKRKQEADGQQIVAGPACIARNLASGEEAVECVAADVAASS